MWKMESKVYNVKNLNDALEGTLMRGYLLAFSKQVSSNMRKYKENNLVLQNIDVLCYSKSPEERVDGLKEDLVERYNKVFSPEYSYIIPESIKVVQALLMDTLVFGYNLSTGDIALYTLNLHALFKMGIDAERLMQVCYDSNQCGIIHAYRIDFDYDSLDRIVYKAVKLISNKKLDTTNFCFFPYDYVLAAMHIVSSCLKRGMTLKITQTVEGLIKKRVVSCNKKVLAEYCDNPKAVEGVNPSFFPLKGYMYLPVVGAPSLTAMVTKVSLFETDTISPILSKEDIGVEKAVNPIESIILKNSITNKLREQYEFDSWAYCDSLEKIPGLESIAADGSMYSFDVKQLGKVLDTLKMDELKDLCFGIEADAYYNDMKGLITCGEVLNVDELRKTPQSELKKMLSTGIYSVVSMGKKGKYYSMIVTNNRDYLKQSYGEDYFGKYEGFNVRFFEMKRRFKYNRQESVEEVLTYCGFPVNEDTMAFAKNLQEEVVSLSEDISISNIGSREKEVFQSYSDVNEKAEASTDGILCRSCFNSVNANGKISDYYRYFSRSRVVKVIKLR